MSLLDRAIIPELVCYEERVTSVWTQALFWSLAAFFSGLLVWRTRMAALDVIAAASLFLAVLFLMCSLNYGTLAIQIRSASPGLRFGIYHLSIPLDNIQACQVDDLPVFM